ncbi:MAG: putative toxin-antitoxin system toxin component, PIN family, partial [Anaerolineae bacterium]|nr:putative toxin-antitoxin system toxin component, PIN family [Anaerolineae bacterium]
MSEPVAPHPLLRVVLDTNVYVSGLILSRGTPFQVLEAWRQQAYILATSEAIIAEIERALRYPRIRDRYGVAEADIDQLVASLRADALVTPGDRAIPPTCADPDDDKFLACALEAQADCIVTGDPHLLTLGGYRGVAILTPREFLA